MKRIATPALLLVTISLVMLAFGDHAYLLAAVCSTYGATHGPDGCCVSTGRLWTRAPMPLAMGPCFPQQSCNQNSALRGGGRPLLHQQCHQAQA